MAVIGIHSPEFEYERDTTRVRKFVEENGISFPVFLDPQHEYWKKLENRYWPTFYLVDREGKIRFVQIGETHPGTPRAAQMERRIKELLRRSE